MVAKVSFSPKDFKRAVAGGAELILKNRYFETNPHLSDDGASLLARPGLKFLANVGEGPIRGLYSEEGSFNGDLFVVSYDTLYRIDRNLNITLLYQGLNNPEQGVVNMTSTSPIGDVPEMLFIADGRNLFVYIENGYATGQIAGAPANSDTVRIDNTYYQFTNGSVDSGSPAGTSGNPWLVALGGTAAQAWANFADAVGATGTEGTTYSTGLTANGAVTVIGNSASFVSIQSNTPGVVGNSVITTETGGAISWTQGGTLDGGGDPQVRVVQMPDDIGAFDVATINSFVIVLPTQVDDFRGTFYWIQPGETTVDPLDYATAERSPDGVNGVEVIGDMFWLPGDGSTEAWYVSQDPINRMQRLQGVVFDRGTWEGTALAIHESLMVCDSNGAVFRITGGSPSRVSPPDIEEEIRNAIEEQRRYTF